MSQTAGSAYARELKLFDAATVVVGGIILTAFLHGWIMLLVSNIAAVAMRFASYTPSLLGSGAIQPLAVGAIVLLTLVNYLGIEPGSLTQSIFTVLEIAAALLLTGAGLVLARSTRPVEAAPVAWRGRSR